MRNSRLKRNQEKETKKYLFLTVSSIIIFVIILIFFGIPLLIQFSLFVSNFASKQANNDTAKETILVSPPELTLPYSATSSAEITIVGTAQKDQKVKIYVNDAIQDETKVTANDSFKFTSIILDEGANRIEAVAITKDNKKSKLSDPIMVQYIKDPPKLDVSSPTENQEIRGGEHNPTTVRGKSDAKASITVNGFWAITDSNGNFHYNLPLRDGENTIQVIATDPAGNKTEKQMKVTFTP